MENTCLYSWLNSWVNASVKPFYSKIQLVLLLTDYEAFLCGWDRKINIQSYRQDAWYPSNEDFVCSHQKLAVNILRSVEEFLQLRIFSASLQLAILQSWMIRVYYFFPQFVLFLINTVLKFKPTLSGRNRQILRSTITWISRHLSIRVLVALLAI